MKTLKSPSLNAMTEMDEPLLKEMSEDSLMAGDMEIRATTGGVAMRRGEEPGEWLDGDNTRACQIGCIVAL